MRRLLVVACFYKPAYVYGGPSRSLPALCEAMVREGVGVTVFTTNADGDRDLDVSPGVNVDVDGVSVTYFPRRHRPRPNFFYSPDLARACSSSAATFDLVYTFGTWTYPALVAGRSSIRSSVPFVVAPRGSLMSSALSRSPMSLARKAPYLLAVERPLINRASWIHCTTGIEARETSRLHLRPPIQVVPNGLDMTQFAALPPRGLLRQRLGLDADAPVSLFAGRLHPFKRLDLAIDAFCRVITHLPQAHLLIVGPDEGDLTRLRQLARFRGVEKNVSFLGPMEHNDLLQAYVDADMGLLFSRSENYGMSAAEAMAVGRPVLVTEGIGLAPLIRDQGAGRVAVSDAAQIARLWIEILADPGGRAEMGAKAATVVRQRLSAQACAREMIRLFSATVAEGISRRDSLVRASA